MSIKLEIDKRYKKQEFPNFKCGVCGEQILKICKDAVITDALGGSVFRNLFQEDKIGLVCKGNHLTIVKSEVAIEAYQLQQIRGPEFTHIWKDELSGIPPAEVWDLQIMKAIYNKKPEKPLP